MARKSKRQTHGDDKSAVAASNGSHVLHGAAPSGAGAWRPVVVSKTVSVSGGYQRKITHAESVEVGEDIFLKVDKNAEWFLKAVGGPSAQKGMLQRVRVIEQLRQACGIDQASPVKARTRQQSEEDPMGTLDACLYDGDASDAKTKRNYYQPKRQREQVVTVDMPLHALGRSGGETVSVRLMAKGTNSMCIHADNVPWLIAYAAEEFARGGVPLQPEGEDSSSVAGNCSVPGLAIRWDFSTNDGWEAVWVDGPLKGNIVRSALSDLTLEKWSRVGGASKFGSELGAASLNARKQAVWALLEMHCSMGVKDATERSAAA